MELDVLDEDRSRPLAVDRQVDQGVRASVSPELLELVGIDRHVRGCLTMPVDDTRQLAIAAETGDMLAGHLAVRGGE
jgi:hypothetical protein